MSNSHYTIDALLKDKPHNLQLFRILHDRINALGDIETVITKTQVSFGAERKFAWLWVTPSTKHFTEGILMLTVDMNNKSGDPIFTSVEETAPNKWTHQVKISDERVVDQILQQNWLDKAYQFGMKK